uniref:Movement protein n=1 Tax=Steinernema glaseri TaxID=37863 RepID=A0A1I7ZXR7_9BILA
MAFTSFLLYFSGLSLVSAAPATISSNFTNLASSGRIPAVLVIYDTHNVASSQQIILLVCCVVAVLLASICLVIGYHKELFHKGCTWRWARRQGPRPNYPKDGPFYISRDVPTTYYELHTGLPIPNQGA